MSSKEASMAIIDRPAVFAAPGEEGSPVSLKPRYENFIGGEWGATPGAERAKVLNAIADAIEENLEVLAVAESWENGKPVRETLAADIPLAIDHFRYFAGALRAQEGGISQLD